MTMWNDYNDADTQSSFDLIPKGTVAPVRMTIRPGGYDDPAQGWTGGYATRNDTTGSVYLNVEFVILEGPFAKRKVWSLIGLMSLKGPEWGNMGRSFVRGILNSSCGLSDKDNSPAAQAARRISGFADLDGIEFLTRIDTGKDGNGDAKNEIRFAVTPDHRDWQTYLEAGNSWRPRAAQAVPAAPATPGQQAQLAAQSQVATAGQSGQQQPAPSPAANPARPAWAQ
jgi:hypothetical protein